MRVLHSLLKKSVISIGDDGNEGRARPICDHDIAVLEGLEASVMGNFTLREDLYQFALLDRIGSNVYKAHTSRDSVRLDATEKRHAKSDHFVGKRHFRCHNVKSSGD